MYQNGSFRERSEWDYDIYISSNGMNLRPGSANRKVVEYLEDKGVRVDWRDGNDVD